MFQKNSGSRPFFLGVFSAKRMQKRMQNQKGNKKGLNPVG